MQTNLQNLISPSQKIAVAVSGGKDSVALLHYTLSQAKLFNFEVKAINVEHGIRGADSVKDSQFVFNLCKDWHVELISYSVDAIKTAKEQKLSIEEAGRKLRYECFFDAIDKGFCDKVATAHHQRDNAESVLFNLFRGTGIKGVTGIKNNYKDKIIRPFLTLKKEDIDEYAQKNQLPFVVDKTNFDEKYTRNFIRLNVLPQIKEVFPEVETSLSRFSSIAAIEDDFIEQEMKKIISFDKDCVKISLPAHPALLSRATVTALKTLGEKKDWEKSHIDSVLSLASSQNGTKISLKNGIICIKEYENLVFYKETPKNFSEIPLKEGKNLFNGSVITIEKVVNPTNLKDGFYADFDKIPKNAVIRYKKDGDLFTKFGGGTKPLAEYLTDVKFPQRERDALPIIAADNIVLAIYGVAISNKIKVDESTKNIIKIF